MRRSLEINQVRHLEEPEAGNGRLITRIISLRKANETNRRRWRGRHSTTAAAVILPKGECTKSSGWN